MFKKGFQVQTPYGKGIVVAAPNRTNTTVQLSETFEVVTVKSEYITALPKHVEGKGWWLPAQAGKVKVGQQVMTIDGQIGTVTRPDGKAWVFTTCKPSNLQIYALRVFVADEQAYVAIDETAESFDHFQPVTEDAQWRSLWKHWVSLFQTTHRKAIENYTSSWYTELNRQLRKGTPASAIHYCDRLDAALAMGQTDRDMVVWRAGSSKFDLNIPVGSTFVDKGFGSCSISKAFAQSWTSGSNGTKALFEIRVPKGSIGGYVGTGIISVHQHEAEFILPRNCTFRVVKIEKPVGGQPRVTCDLVKQGE